MDEIKNIILKTLENKKQEIINEYDYKMKQILNENNIAKLYYLLAEIFHNTMEQGENRIIQIIIHISYIFHIVFGYFKCK